MTTRRSKRGAGWTVTRSIALEIDFALEQIGSKSLEELPEVYSPFVQLLPQEWWADWADLLGASKEYGNFLTYAALLAGVLEEDDYTRATLAMREMSLAGAMMNAEAQAARMGLEANTTLPLDERFVDLFVRMSKATYVSVDLEVVSPASFDRRRTREGALLVRILRGGDRHARFWHWLDRFYFECYRPLRQTRLDFMDTQEERALTALGAREQEGQVPDTSWLPPQSSLLNVTGISEAVQSGRLKVIFWVDPFQLFDYFVVLPGQVVVPFAEAGPGLANFRAWAADIAARASALGDPTRLTILRMIRHLEKDNTEMATFLGIARPTVSVHAKVLREAGLIETLQEGRQARHKVNTAAVRRLLLDLERFLSLPEEE